MFLNQRQIQQLVAENNNFIAPFDKKLLKPASYTFRFGSSAGHNTPEEGIIIQPSEFINIESLETVHFPDTVLGILSTRGSIAQAGLDCLLTDTIIEPGSQGKLRFSCKNNSDHPISLKFGQPLVKCVFSKIG